MLTFLGSQTCALLLNVPILLWFIKWPDDDFLSRNWSPHLVSKTNKNCCVLTDLLLSIKLYSFLHLFGGTMLFVTITHGSTYPVSSLF